MSIGHLAAMKRPIERDIAPQIGERETWARHVDKRGSQCHTGGIGERMAVAIGRKVDLESPDKLVHVDILRERVALSLLRAGEAFSSHGEVHA
jgi:tRNA(Ser,Leu) C12 N-acetylase TAN1